MPNLEEMVVIGNLAKAKYALVTEDSSTRLGEEELNPMCSDLLADPNVQPILGVTPIPNCVQRQKRQADNVLLISDSTYFNWKLLFIIMMTTTSSICMLVSVGNFYLSLTLFQLFLFPCSAA